MIHIVHAHRNFYSILCIFNIEIERVNRRKANLSVMITSFVNERGA